jgi:hypothetical protein
MLARHCIDIDEMEEAEQVCEKALINVLEIKDVKV